MCYFQSYRHKDIHFAPKRSERNSKIDSTIRKTDFIANIVIFEYIANEFCRFSFFL